MKHLLFLLPLIILFSCNGQSNQTLDAKAFSAKIQAENNPAILDVRTPEEFSGGYISGAININYNSDEFNKKVGKLNKDETIYIYCLAGSRSADAAKEMRESGFKNVMELKGGILKWKAAGLNVTPATNGAKISMSMEEFKKLTTDTVPVLVDFSAPWCGPCRKMLPMLAELTKEQQSKMKLVTINIDEHTQLTEQLGVTEIPVFVVYKNGVETARKSGLQTKEGLLKILF